jgi:hypothetical protein
MLCLLSQISGCFGGKDAMRYDGVYLQQHSDNNWSINREKSPSGNFVRGVRVSTCRKNYTFISTSHHHQHGPEEYCGKKPQNLKRDEAEEG